MVLVLPPLLPHILVHLLLPSPGRRPLNEILRQAEGGLSSVAVVMDAVGVFALGVEVAGVEVVGLLVVLV